MLQRIKKFFSDSEVIFWARLQVLVGGLAVLITYVEPSLLQKVMPGEWAPYVLLVHGFALEYLRRRRAKDV
jgi:hypothetical protein